MEMVQLAAIPSSLPALPAIQVGATLTRAWKSTCVGSDFICRSSRRFRTGFLRNTWPPVHRRIRVRSCPLWQDGSTVALMGMSPEAFETRNLTVAEGVPHRRPTWTCSERDGAGADVASKLFPFGGALGTGCDSLTLNIRWSVSRAEGEHVRQSRDNFIAIPITTVLNRYGRETSVQIQGRRRVKDFNDTVEQTRGLRALRKVPPGEEDDFGRSFQRPLTVSINHTGRADWGGNHQQHRPCWRRESAS